MTSRPSLREPHTPPGVRDGGSWCPGGPSCLIDSPSPGVGQPHCTNFRRYFALSSSAAPEPIVIRRGLQYATSVFGRAGSPERAFPDTSHPDSHGWPPTPTAAPEIKVGRRPIGWTTRTLGVSPPPTIHRHPRLQPRPALIPYGSPTRPKAMWGTPAGRILGHASPLSLPTHCTCLRCPHTGSHPIILLPALACSRFFKDFFKLFKLFCAGPFHSSFRH